MIEKLKSFPILCEIFTEETVEFSNEIVEIKNKNYKDNFLLFKIPKYLEK